VNGMPDGNETEEIEDLSTIRKGVNFPENAKKSKRKKTSLIRRYRSHQNMAADDVFKTKKKSTDSENDTDEKFDSKSRVNESIHSIKKPDSVSSHQ